MYSQRTGVPVEEDTGEAASQYLRDPLGSAHLVA
jgi:hypothetical protein